MLDLWRDVSAQFPGVRNAGIDSCRKISGSSSWSQHAWGNALDIGVGTNQALGDLVYQYLVRNKTRFGLGTICWKSAGGCDPAAHKDHVHVEGLPKRRGTPPCAGGDQGRDEMNPGRDSADPGGSQGEGWDPFGLGGIGEAIGVLFEVETWVRVLWFLGGAALTGYALVMFMRELGIEPPLPSNAIGQLLGGNS